MIKKKNSNLTAEQIKEDIEKYDNIKMVLDQYKENLQYIRNNADNITIDSVIYYLNDTGQKAGLAFHAYRTLSVQSIIDSLEQNIKDIERELADIREKYKGLIDFEG